MVRVKVPISPGSLSLPQGWHFLSPLFCSSVRGKQKPKSVESNPTNSPRTRAPDPPPDSPPFPTPSILAQPSPRQRPHYMPSKSQPTPLFFERRRQSHRPPFVSPPFRATARFLQTALRPPLAINSIRKGATKSPNIGSITRALM